MQTTLCCAQAEFVRLCRSVPGTVDAVKAELPELLILFVTKGRSSFSVERDSAAFFCDEIKQLMNERNPLELQVDILQARRRYGEAKLVKMRSRLQPSNATSLETELKVAQGRASLEIGRGAGSFS